MSYLKGLVLAAFAVLVPIHSAMAVAGILILVDMLLGIWAAKKRGEAITSAAMRRTISKMCIYQVTIITGFLCEKYLVSDLLPISKLVAGVVGMVEMKSILENANQINGGSIFSSVINALGSSNDNHSPEPPGAA